MSKYQYKQQNKFTPELLKEDVRDYNHVGIDGMLFPVHRIMKRFLHNPVPGGKHKFTLIDHINSSNKTLNAIENLRYNNHHLNALNKLLLTDVYYDNDIRMWNATFGTHKIRSVQYHVGYHTSFFELWKAYRKKRQQVYHYWEKYYIEDYKKQHGMS